MYCPLESAYQTAWSQPPAFEGTVGSADESLTDRSVLFAALSRTA
jgi:hypothetical protein